MAHLHGVGGIHEPGDAVGYFFGLEEALHRNHFFGLAAGRILGDPESFGHGMDAGLRHGCVHPARRHGIHVDALGNQFQRQGLRQPQETVFGRTVGAVARHTEAAQHRGHQDDAAALAELRCEGPYRIPTAREIRQKDGIEGFIDFKRIAVHWRHTRNARGGNHAIQPRNARTHRPQGDPVRDAGGVEVGLATGSGHLFNHGGQRCFIAPQQMEVGTQRREMKCHGATNSAGGAGDEKAAGHASP